jgi:hypothetical protein
MMRKIFFITLCMAIIPVLVYAHVEKIVDVRIVSDNGEEFTKYRTYPQIHQKGMYFFLEAVKGERYSIQLTNKSDRRIGVVIAVDGRNIISAEKSNLERHERMYIINLYETSVFNGWRTSMDTINRFYFTEQSNSYAEKVFSDASAMGTIALAVYMERLPKIMPRIGGSSQKEDAPAAAMPYASDESQPLLSLNRAKQKKSDQAGTGFGETAHSSAVMVQFEPERAAADRIVLKYEWRSKLCKKGIINYNPKNRFWPDNQKFAPYPRDFEE